MPRKRMKPDGEGFGNLSCSFCGKNQREVKKLIAGPTVYICDECIDMAVDICKKDDSNSAPRTSKPTKVSLTPAKIHKHLCETVIGQEGTKRTLAVALYNHLKRVSNPGLKLEKSNILMVGPSGSGKTHIVRALAEAAGVPFVVSDATSLTESGYVGDDVESILSDLYHKAGEDLELTERGIVFIDEIDKLSGRSDSVSTTRDVGGKSVQQCLLKLIEGSEVYFSNQRGRKHSQAETIKVNTSNILFICGGAFVGLDQIVEARYFNKDPEILPEDLFKFGMIPELIGRLPVITKLHELTEANLIDILTRPSNAIVSQFKTLFRSEGVQLNVDEYALMWVAQEAIKRNTGARGLRSILENSIGGLVFDLPDRKDLKGINLSATDDGLTIQEVKKSVKPKKPRKRKGAKRDQTKTTPTNR